MTIKVESREDIIDRVGRSPDRATAVVLANIDTPKVADRPPTAPADSARPRPGFARANDG